MARGAMTLLLPVRWPTLEKDHAFILALVTATDMQCLFLLQTNAVAENNLSGFEFFRGLGVGTIFWKSNALWVCLRRCGRCNSKNQRSISCACCYVERLSSSFESSKDRRGHVLPDSPFEAPYVPRE